MKTPLKWSWHKAVDRFLRLMVGTPGIAMIAIATGTYLAEWNRAGFLGNLAILIFLVVMHEKDYLELQKKARPFPYRWTCDRCDDGIVVSSDNESVVLRVKLDHIFKTHPEWTTRALP